jgi:hypothetical protein
MHANAKVNAIANANAKHNFNSIGAILAELEAFLNLTRNNEAKAKAKAKAAKCGANSLFFDKSGNHPIICICICNKTVHIYKYFEHSFGPIRAILAELEAFQILG